MAQFPLQPEPAQTRQPLLWAALAYSFGLCIGFYFWRPPTWWLVAAIAFIVFGSYYLRHRVICARILALASVFAAGALVMQTFKPADPGLRVLRFANQREVLVTAHVTKEGAWEEHGPGEFRQLVDVETESIQTDGSTFPVRSGVRLGIYAKLTGRTAIPPNFLYGQRIRFLGKLSAPHNYRDPGVFDYREYLAEHQIAAVGSARLESTELLTGFAGNRAEFWCDRVHASIIAKIHVLWPPAQAALMDAMVIGDESFLSLPMKINFQRTGTYHLLVVSGMNVGILAYVAFWFFRRLSFSDLFAGLCTVALTVCYAVLTGVGPPVWRATLMLILFLGTRLLYRERSMLNAIGVAAFGVLLADPRALFGASFQMTFLCVLLIAGAGVPILERTSQPFIRGLRQIVSTSYDAYLPPSVAQFRIDLRLVAHRLRRTLGKRTVLPLLAFAFRLLLGTFEVLFISALMQIGLALPMAYYFHRVTITALPANILALPLMEIMMPAAVLAVFLGFISLMLAKIPAIVAGLALEGITHTIHLLGGLRVSDARVAMPTLFVIIAAALALAASMLLARKRLAYSFAGLAILGLSALWIAVVPPRPQLRPGALEVTAIDVGQGDALLIVFPQGHTLLVDAGGLPQWAHSDFDVGEEVVSPYLWTRGISHLDAVAVTHPHADHIGGMAAVLEDFHPRELWIGANSHSVEMQRLLNEARKLGITVVPHSDGDEFMEERTTIHILAPDGSEEESSRSANEDSLVMKISYGKTSALLEGDAEKKAERRIAQEQPQADLLKVAHHGSATSTIPELLDAVHPRFAVISVVATHLYGHPRREVLQRLADAHVLTYRTDLDGAVSFYLDGKTVTPLVPELQ
jgi:competence protein ComEC